MFAGTDLNPNKQVHNLNALGASLLARTYPYAGNES